LTSAAFAQQGSGKRQFPHPRKPVPRQPNAPQATERQGAYKIQSQVSLVVLHASVLNDRSVFVPGLDQDNFKVFEDKVEQKLSVFKQEDVPVSFGLVSTTAAACGTNGPGERRSPDVRQDVQSPGRRFVVNFNDDYYLDTEHDFTSDLDEMKTRWSASTRAAARRSTTP
jgi:Ca-activated chloride channel homolog